MTAVVVPTTDAVAVPPPVPSATPDAAQRLGAIVRLQREIGALRSSDRDRLLQLVADHSLVAFGQAGGAIVTILARGQLQVRATAGSSTPAGGADVDLFGSLTGIAVRTRETLFTDDVALDPRVDRAIAAATGMGSAIVAPLLVGDRVAGALTLSSPLTAAFDRADADQLTLFADALGGALRHATESSRYAELYTRTKRALEAVETSEARFRAAFDNSPLGMMVLRVEAAGPRIVQVNDAAAEIFGIDCADLLGRSVADLLAAADPLPAGPLVERRSVRPDGHEIWTRWHLAELPDGADGSRALLAQIDDITDRRAAVHALRRQARLLDLIPEPVIIRSLDGTVRYWNAGAEAVYGYPSFHAVGKRTHDLLMTRFDDITVPELEAQLASTGVWSGQLRHRHADGRTLRMASKHICDAHDDGEPVILEINIDVSERVAAEQALAASEAKFRSQFAHSTVGQLIRAADGMIEEANPALARMLGYRVEDLVGTRADALYDPAAAGQVDEMRRLLGSGETDSVEMEMRLVRADGSLLDVEAHGSVVRDADGAIAQVIGLFQDITTRKQAEQALHHRALHDSLTGLANRVQLSDRLDAVMAQGAESDGTVGLLYLDLDGFKAVNDDFGHEVGDALLIEVAARLHQCVRTGDGDVVARIGGDEFVVLCPDLDAPDALRIVADRALDRLRGAYFVAGRRITSVSASIGMTFPVPGQTAAEALHAADTAMYDVKRTGKNRVALAR